MSYLILQRSSTLYRQLSCCSWARVYERSQSTTIQRFLSTRSYQEQTDNQNDIIMFNKIEPWKNLLNMPARAPWKVSETDGVIEKVYQNVLDDVSGSNKRFKKIHENIIKMQRALIGKRDRERLRVLKNIKYRASEQKTDESIQTTMYGPEEVVAAIMFRLKPNYYVVKRVFEETESLLGPGNFNPKNVLDFGSGVGSASAAAWSVWKNSIEWIHGVDASKTMREASSMIVKEFISEDTTTGVNLTSAAHLSSEASPAAFDLALLAYTATDLPHNSATLTAAALLWDKLLPNGVFVMIEPGTPDGFSSIRTVRNMLLDCCTSEYGDGCQILAPCTHKGSCPMERFQIQLDRRRSGPTSQVDDITTRDDQDYEDNDNNANEDDESSDSDSDSDDGNEDDGLRKGFCSFVQSIPSDKTSRNGEKFSYLVVRKVSDSVKEPVNKFEGDKMARILRQALQADMSSGEAEKILEETIELEDRYLSSDEDDLGLELVRGNNTRDFGRIIHAPKKKRGHVLIDSCVGPGTIVRHKISKSASRTAPGIFHAARKSRWGGFWPNTNETNQ